MSALIEVQGISKHFGGVSALEAVDVAVSPGEVLGLIGPNGAGKTTLFNVISGFLKPNGGRIRFKGGDITGLPPDRLARKGIVRTFQNATLFDECTVLENVLIGCHLHAQPNLRGFWSTVFGTNLVKRTEAKLLENSLSTLEFVGLSDRKDQLAKNLSHGHKKALTLAVAMGCGPQLLLLDEPMAAVNPEEIVMLAKLLRMIVAQGTAIILVEHNVRAVFDICERIAVISSGKKIAEGTPSEVSNNQEVIRAYLGVKKHAVRA